MSQAPGLPGASVNLRLVEFVQAQPPERTASEIVELAKEAGLELELMQVYKFRELLRARQARSTSTSPKDPTMTPDESPAEATQAPEDTKAPEASPPQAKAGRGRPGRRPGGENTRAGWVRSLPLDVPVKEVVEKAKEKGWEMTEGYVYAIRSKMKAPKKPAKKPATKPAAKAPARGAKEPKKAKGKPGKAAEPKAQGKSKRGRPSKKQEKAAGGASGALFRKPSEADVRKVEEEFAKLALEIGLLRSGQMLQELQGRLAELVRPKGRG